MEGTGNSSMEEMPPQWNRCRSECELEVSRNPKNYDAWHDYIRFERSEGKHWRIRNLFERAIENVPVLKKHFWWPQYVNLWLAYARFEEGEAEDIERSREVYSRCIQLIPHKRFSFVKVWLSAARFEIKQGNFMNARILYESALEKCPDREIFKAYINLEVGLDSLRRCRLLYMRYVQWSPDDDYSSWIEYTEFERSVSNPERARFIYDIATNQPALWTSEPLWNSYINFEISKVNIGKVRELFECLVRRKKHVNPWIKYAKFEASMLGSMVKEVPDVKEDRAQKFKQKDKKVRVIESYIKRVRYVFEEGIFYFRSLRRPHLEEQAMGTLLAEWEILERGFGSFGDVNLVLNKALMYKRSRGNIIIS